MDLNKSVQHISDYIVPETSYKDKDKVERRGSTCSVFFNRNQFVFRNTGSTSSTTARPIIYPGGNSDTSGPLLSESLPNFTYYYIIQKRGNQFLVSAKEQPELRVRI